MIALLKSLFSLALGLLLGGVLAVLITVLADFLRFLSYWL